MGLLKEERVCPTFIINIISLGCSLFAIGSWAQLYTHKDYFSADRRSVFPWIRCPPPLRPHVCVRHTRLWESVQTQAVILSPRAGVISAWASWDRPSRSRLGGGNESPCPVFLRLLPQEFRIIHTPVPAKQQGERRKERQREGERGGRRVKKQIKKARSEYRTMQDRG